MVIVYEALPLAVESLAVTENVKVPAVVGVPSINQVFPKHCGELVRVTEAICRPGGSDEPTQVRLRRPMSPPAASSSKPSMVAGGVSHIDSIPP